MCFFRSLPSADPEAGAPMRVQVISICQQPRGRDDARNLQLGSGNGNFTAAALRPLDRSTIAETNITYPSLLTLSSFN